MTADHHKYPTRIINLGRTSYPDILESMHTHIRDRQVHHNDQIWLTEHAACYTLNPQKNHDHIISKLPYPLYDTDRGGNITFHAPGQLMIYFMLNIKRQGNGIRHLVDQIEEFIIRLLSFLGIEAQGNSKARGVYVKEKKIASLGLKVKPPYNGCAINVNMDMKPFNHINPCGLNIQMTHIQDHVPNITIHSLIPFIVKALKDTFPISNDSIITHDVSQLSTLL